MRLGLLIVAIASILVLPAFAAAAGADLPSSARPARAQPRNPIDRSYADPGAATFTSFDVDRDGYISREEAAASSELTRRFGTLDKNGDGRLSLSELTGWRHRAYAGSSKSSSTASGGKEIGVRR